MIRLLAFLIYMMSYLVYSLPTLSKMKKLHPEMPVDERDRLIHQTPSKWSKTIMKITGSHVQVKGQELIPDGPVVFVCNHEGDFDIPVLLANIEKPFGFISKVEVKKAPIISSWMEVMNCVFIDRKDRRSAVKSIREGVEKLKNGHSIVIFPEGTRSKGGPIGEFKTGGLRLAKDAGVPIVPIGIKGTSDIFEKNGRLVRPANVQINICQPIDPSVFQQRDLKETAVAVRKIIIDSFSL
ncbi:1-acyl-sn-glycerol-3-phosphate acyltransferase [Cytobacillus eiseniae]|uniref:1-acyl-sn-glycerol-3-phosphate acyltransferase n=1 Tax=Cytobacillus eiseniae TaxID=762947 RepID=A0ABS4REB7_9BACI|nr:lysophospholipid acyltransferase family protein [Cytobacillus eiseniae]MBP2241252.1 1-acyl-sn-glycerol-3-phosphate acyltransferase [Cytobacillus eiseniae]